jgi:hypothetical protein
MVRVHIQSRCVLIGGTSKNRIDVRPAQTREHPMNIQVRRAEYTDVEGLRELYRQEANCQVIHDSILRRGLADPYLIFVNDRLGGYGGVWNSHSTGFVMEFSTLPVWRRDAQRMFRALLEESHATGIEAQTNMTLMLTMLYDFATNIRQESILFEDSFTTNLPSAGGVFRRAASSDVTRVSDDAMELGDWVIEVDGEIAGTGGFLCHYNPPYGDIFMHVADSMRRNGIGSYLVQELKRVCYESGRKPAARCSPMNLASRRTLQKAGLLPCGRLLVGEVGLA